MGIEEIRKVAVETLRTGTVVDQYAWNVFCTMLKTFPSSDDFSTDDLFQILTQCCAACQWGIRHDEEHTPCCGDCAKDREQSADITPFVMKNYYHAHNKKYDDARDIWFAHDAVPVVYRYEVIPGCASLGNNFRELCKNTCACCSRPILPEDLRNTLRYIV